MDKDIIAQEINAEYLKGYIYSIKRCSCNAGYGLSQNLWL